jgi:dipeptide transport system ATP-binding protein
MCAGETAETGAVRDIFHRAAHPCTHALLSSSPELDPEARRDRVDLEGEIPSLIN